MTHDPNIAAVLSHRYTPTPEEVLFTRRVRVRRDEPARRRGGLRTVALWISALTGTART